MMNRILQQTDRLCIQIDYEGEFVCCESYLQDSFFYGAVTPEVEASPENGREENDPEGDAGWS